MTPPARTQAAIELLDQVIAAARDNGPAADVLASRYFMQRRYAGSKDRRAVRELVFAAIRLCGERPASGRAAMMALAEREEALGATFDGSPHGPAERAAGELVAVPGPAPRWLVERLEASGLSAPELPALIDRAPLDVRINRLAGHVPDLVGAAPIDGLPDARRLLAGTDLTPFAGQVEVQDAGSQIAALAVGAEPGEQVVDLCAGGGGKTLALAAAMANRGAILACDADRARLSRLAPRAEQAGVSIVETLLLNPNREAEALADWRERADRVMVDAPCSGTGTWRRNPEARWRLTPDRLGRLVQLQAHLLDVGARLVRPGGVIVHVVCSLLDEEGRGQAVAFLGRHPGWTADPLDLPFGRPHGPGVRLTPASDGTDGFYIARLRRPC